MTKDIVEIEKVENGYVVKYKTGFTSRRRVFHTINDVIDYLRLYFDDPIPELPLTFMCPKCNLQYPQTIGEVCPNCDKNIFDR